MLSWGRGKNEDEAFEVCQKGCERVFGDICLYCIVGSCICNQWKADEIEEVCLHEIRVLKAILVNLVCSLCKNKNWFRQEKMKWKKYK